MLKRLEYYCYISEPSDYPIEKVCDDGTEKIILDGTVLNERKVSIYKKATGEFRTGTASSRSIKLDKATKKYSYHSDGAKLPAQFQGIGEVHLMDNMGDVLEKRIGMIFTLHTVYIVLNEALAKKLIHPFSIWE